MSRISIFTDGTTNFGGGGDIANLITIPDSGPELIFDINQEASFTYPNYNLLIYWGAGEESVPENKFNIFLKR